MKRRLAAARAAEAEWCRAALARERERLRRRAPADASAADPADPADPAGPAGRLADLAAYAGLVERVNPWLIDLPTMRRFVLYLLIPLLSWIGSAIVQELVQQSLSRP